jgi:hypothetical protein
METTVDKEEVFFFLDTLRESGAVNMFGAGFYVQEEFNVSRREGKELVIEWMKTFGERNGR